MSIHPGSLLGGYSQVALGQHRYRMGCSPPRCYGGDPCGLHCPKCALFWTGLQAPAFNEHMDPSGLASEFV